MTRRHKERMTWVRIPVDKKISKLVHELNHTGIATHTSCEKLNDDEAHIMIDLENVRFEFLPHFGKYGVLNIFWKPDYWEAAE